jgi:peroxiredoxin
LQKSLEALRARGLRIVAISVDAPKVSREHAAKMGYTFAFLSDESMEVIGRYDLFHEKGRTRTGDDIARPAEFLLDSSGVVRWVNLTDDYRVRLEPETLFEVLEGLEGAGGKADLTEENGP